MPELNPDEFETVYHASFENTPPHMMDNPSRVVSDDSDPDAFFAGTARSAGDRAAMGRRYMHRYRVPRSSMSEELYGDDHMYAMDAFISDDPEKAKFDRALADQGRAGALYAQGDQPELWQTTPVSKKEAVDSGRVLRYRNMYEDAGKDSVLIPKSAMRDRGVEYMGTDDLHEFTDGEFTVGSFPTANNNKLERVDRYVASQKTTKAPTQDPALAQAIAEEADQRKNRSEEARNRRNQLPLFDMPIDASNISVLD